MHHDLQRDTTFKVSLEDSSGDDDMPVYLLIKDRKLKWGNKPLNFISRQNDTPYIITSKYFFDSCYLQQVGVPLAFGEEYGISATNQMFATLAGGFLPYIFRTVLFKQVGPVTVDPDNLSLKSKFKRKIEEYTQNWIVSDSKSTTVKVDSDPHVDIHEKSKDEEVMLQEITPIIKNDTSDKIDILIYDKFTV